MQSYFWIFIFLAITCLYSSLMLDNLVEDEEDENSFSVLRQAVKENWTTMKEYYKAVSKWHYVLMKFELIHMIICFLMSIVIDLPWNCYGGFLSSHSLFCQCCFFAIIFFHSNITITNLRWCYSSLVLLLSSFCWTGFNPF